MWWSIQYYSFLGASIRQHHYHHHHHIILMTSHLTTITDPWASICGDRDRIKDDDDGDDDDDLDQFILNHH